MENPRISAKRYIFLYIIFSFSFGLFVYCYIFLPKILNEKKSILLNELEKRHMTVIKESHGSSFWKIEVAAGIFFSKDKNSVPNFVIEGKLLGFQEMQIKIFYKKSDNYFLKIIDIFEEKKWCFCIEKF